MTRCTLCGCVFLSLTPCVLTLVGTLADMENAGLSHISPLPSLGAGGGTSISGISSGADFAVYFAIANSASVQGAGIFAGNVYRCYTTRFPGDDVVP